MNDSAWHHLTISAHHSSLHLQMMNITEGLYRSIDRPKECTVIRMEIHCTLSRTEVVHFKEQTLLLITPTHTCISTTFLCLISPSLRPFARPFLSLPSLFPSLRPSSPLVSSTHTIHAGLFTNLAEWTFTGLLIETPFEHKLPSSRSTSFWSLFTIFSASVARFSAYNNRRRVQVKLITISLFFLFLSKISDLTFLKKISRLLEFMTTFLLVVH